MFLMMAQKNGMSAKSLQRLMGFGSYQTAWTWLHKLRAALSPEDREPLGPFVQVDEALVGGKGGPHKELVLAAADLLACRGPATDEAEQRARPGG